MLEKKRHLVLAGAASIYADSGLNAFDAYAAPISLGGWRVDGGVPYAVGIAIGLKDAVANTACVVGVGPSGQWHTCPEKAVQARAPAE